MPASNCLTGSTREAAQSRKGGAMAVHTNGRRATPPRPFTKRSSIRQSNNITTAEAKPQLLSGRRCDHCGRQAPRLARYVERPGAGGTDCCARCYRWLVGASSPPSNPQQTLARANWRELFRNSGPRVACGLGDTRRAQVLPPTPIATTPARIPLGRRSA